MKQKERFRENSQNPLAKQGYFKALAQTNENEWVNAKNTAINQLENYFLEKLGINVGAFEDKEDVIENLLRQHKPINSFDRDGNMTVLYTKEAV